MNNQDPELHICMERASLENLPPLILREGFTIRSIEEHEGVLWEQVMDSSYGGYVPGDFQRIMVDNYDYDPSRVFVMFYQFGLPCATATSWRQHYRWGEGVGYVLFVGVSKPYQGHGLGYWMTLHILYDFVRNSLSPAILETGDSNYPALKTYLKLGFVPRIVHLNQYQCWERIFQAFHMERIDYPTDCRPPLDVPHPPRPYPYELRRKKTFISCRGNYELP